MSASEAAGPAPAACQFCRIARGEAESHVVLEDEVSIAFLDRRPLFPGHCLLIPRAHHVTLMDLPPALLRPFFSNAQLLCRAMERALGAEGTFVAINNRVSQSVAHLHVHVVPRRHKDGLRGFFWPRGRYEDARAAAETRAALRAAVEALRAEGGARPESG